MLGSCAMLACPNLTTVGDLSGRFTSVDDQKLFTATRVLTFDSSLMDAHLVVAHFLAF